MAKTFALSLMLIPLVFAAYLTLAVEVEDPTCPGGRYKCQPDQTCCRATGGKFACCPYDNGVCCSDLQSCCPNGFQCNVTGHTCYKRRERPETVMTSTTELPRQHPHVPFKVIEPATEDTNANSTVLGHMENVHFGKQTCPDGKQKCPESYTCCMQPSGGYGCCPLTGGTCCADKVHCCPMGTRCNTNSGSCDS